MGLAEVASLRPAVRLPSTMKNFARTAITTLAATLAFSAFAQETPVPPDECLITKDQIGLVKVGETIGDMKKRFAKTDGEFTYHFVSAAGDGYSGVEVKRFEQSLVMAFTEPLEQMSDDAVIEMATTDFAGFRSASGVGPGMMLRTLDDLHGSFRLEAADMCGGAEHVVFGDQKVLAGVGLLTQSPTVSFQEAGVYEESNEPFRATTKFRPFSYVQTVMVQLQRPAE